MQRGVQYSAILHLVILALVTLGLPDFFKPERHEQPVAISVEILPVADQSNVPNRMKSQPKKPEPKKPVPPVKKEPVKKPQPPVKKEQSAPKEEAIPTPTPEKPKPEKKKETDKKKEEPKPKESEKKKDDEEDLMAVLKAVQETAQDAPEETSESEDETSPSRSDSAYIDSLPLSMSEQDAIRSQIAKCWNMPAGAKDAHELIVVLRLTLNQDGSLINAYLHKSQQGRYSSDTFFRAAVDSAMRAVRSCTPLQNLPADKYERWKDIELTFDPKDMLY